MSICFMQRFKKVLKLNKDKPNNFYYEMANGPLDDALKLAEETWQMVNLVNLRDKGRARGTRRTRLRATECTARRCYAQHQCRERF